MAKVRLNTAIQGASGSVGDMVLRRHKGGVVWQKHPQRRQPWSHRQEQHRRIFGSHVAYALRVRADPALRAAYAAAGAARKKPLNFYQAALKDHANPPTIPSVHCPHYTLADGGELEIFARDDFKITGVQVVERDADANVVGTGPAQCRGRKWYYRVSPARATPVTNVVVTVFDLPGNFAVGKFDLLKRVNPANTCAPFVG
jgi:hypothetical protein